MIFFNDWSAHVRPPNVTTAAVSAESMTPQDKGQISLDWWTDNLFSQQPAVSIVSAMVIGTALVGHGISL